jgi:hypothetical protein
MTLRSTLILVARILSLTSTIPLAAQTPTLHGPSFIPDGKISGSSLTGMHTLGDATWSVANGEITAKGGKAGGWLVSDKSYQDVGVYTAFKCQGHCDTGILVRMEKSADGIKGNFVSLKDDNMGSANVVIDSTGKLVSETDEARVGAMIRFAPPPNPNPTAARQGGGLPRPTGPNPIQKPKAGIWADQWNEVEALVDADILRGFLNEGGESFNAGAGDMHGYGPFALYVGPNCEVHFKNVGYKDIAFKKMPAEVVGAGFRKQEISPFYYGWSADAADFNHDGKMDIVSGAYIYFGPDFTVRREISPAETANPSNQYLTELYHAFDYTRDGWADILSTNLGAGGAAGAFLYVNPKGESRRWDKYKVIPSISSEESVIADIDGDGIPELVYIAEGYMRYAKPDPSDPTKPWIQHNISEKGAWSAHGIGTGDINGDGKIDIVGAFGWWEQPRSGLGSDAPWTYHEQAFGRSGRISAGGAKIGVYDVNGDGLNDVVTALEAHSWGLAWYEQKRDASGNISFVEHIVMDNFNSGKNADVAFAELHGTEIADIDGDGIPDYIVGKRVYSHQDDFYDPDPYSGAFLYWFKTVRDKNAPGGAVLEPHIIHNWSGAGSELRAVDLNGDGKPEIITSTKLGTFVFWNEMPATKAKK